MSDLEKQVQAIVAKANEPIENQLRLQAAVEWSLAADSKHNRSTSIVFFDDAVGLWLKLWSLEEFFRINPGGDKLKGLLRDQHENLQLIAKRMCPVLRRHSQHEAHRRLGAGSVPEVDPW